MKEALLFLLYFAGFEAAVIALLWIVAAWPRDRRPPIDSDWKGGGY